MRKYLWQTFNWNSFYSLGKKSGYLARFCFVLLLIIIMMTASWTHPPTIEFHFAHFKKQKHTQNMRKNNNNNYNKSSNCLMASKWWNSFFSLSLTHSLTLYYFVSQLLFLRFKQKYFNKKKLLFLLNLETKNKKKIYIEAKNK